MYTIANDFLEVRVREQGAELVSLVAKATGVEHLWQASPEFWEWHAPVLFPVVGRCLSDEIIVAGKHYPMEKHGFARRLNFECMEHTAQKIVFRLQANDVTSQHYPFDFEFYISYQLHYRQLISSFEVFNRSMQPMPFQLGGHPAFAVPFNREEAYEDYYVRFEQPETSQRHLINANGFFNGEAEEVFYGMDVIALHRQLFDKDALIFKDLKSRQVTLGGKSSTHKVTLHFREFDYLGVWAKPGADFVCLEPWLGCADHIGKQVAFKDREGVVILPPQERFNTSFTIEVS